MFVRMSTIESTPDRLDAGIKFTHDQIPIDQLKDKGLKRVELLVDRKAAKVVALTFWESEQALIESARDADQIRARINEAFGAIRPPQREHFELVDTQESLAPSGEPSAQQRVKALAERFFTQVLANKDDKALNEMVSPDYVNHDPTNPPDLARGPAGIKQFTQAMNAAFPDMELSLDAIIPAERHVTVLWRWQGTHEGDFFGMAPSGYKVSVTGMSLLRLDNDKIAEQWDYWDALGLIQQLTSEEGARPGPITYMPSQDAVAHRKE